MARFETVAHRWVHVGEPGFGVAVANAHEDVLERADLGVDRVRVQLVGALHDELLARGHVVAHQQLEHLLGAFAVGLLHGIGGSAGVGILLVSTIDRTALAIGALGILAAFTAVSMTLLTTGFGLRLGRRSLGRLAPALGVASLAFGLWYALGAQNLLPYYF
jgi:hypothetical protein